LCETLRRPGSLPASRARASRRDGRPVIGAAGGGDGRRRGRWGFTGDARDVTTAGPALSGVVHAARRAEPDRPALRRVVSVDTALRKHCGTATPPVATRRVLGRLLGCVAHVQPARAPTEERRCSGLAPEGAGSVTQGWVLTGDGATDDGPVQRDHLQRSHQMHRIKRIITITAVTAATVVPALAVPGTAALGRTRRCAP
jgi:hypothetical protein